MRVRSTRLLSLGACFGSVRSFVRRPLSRSLIGLICIVSIITSLLHRLQHSSLSLSVSP